jgi:hypothetical protein
MKDPDQAWRKLVAAARQTPSVQEPPKPAPASLAGRVVALRQSIVAFARMLFWRRWSAAAALLCCALFLAIFAIHRCTDSKPPLIDTPDPFQTTP